MHLSIAGILLAASSAVAVPAPAATTKPAYPTPTFTCPQGLTAQLAHFDDLAKANGNSHPVRPSPAPYAGVYKNIYYGPYEWQIVSPGRQNIRFGYADDDISTTFNMSTHSGINALTTTESEQTSFGVYYSSNYFNMKELWVRGEKSGAFVFQLSCFVIPPSGNKKTVTYQFNVPQPKTPADFYQVKLNANQQKAVQYASSCTIGAKDEDQFVLFDDIGYCMYVKPGNPV